MKLENKKALVTGASRGIGKAITELFLNEGAELWGLGTREPEGLVKLIEKSGSKFHWASADLGELNQIETVVEKLLKESGGFDILINNAGITRDNLSFRMSLEDWQKVLDVNLTASFLVTRAVGKDMIQKRRGSIVNISSVTGVHGNGGQVNYAASKAGLIGMSKSFAKETASRNVRVNIITPGFIETDMTAAMGQAAKQNLTEAIPLKRTGAPEDIAEAALFLASDSSSYITGQILSVDGGLFI